MVQENRTLYGKYVSYNYLRVEYQRNSFLQGNSITLLSAVDGRGLCRDGLCHQRKARRRTAAD